ncbi:ABC transporter ATP-binding protein [Erwiniaceae bacterium BAC15a-03b]|uniref:ABC transporter ATP-binding protein n=1 Tax=Winslowiella arboricola TaxID=2978220 RepID=A0A9J6PVL5_9GAMM|nr:ABC transporter ATP-binding protein [Winslowiella arboricola]MCU5774519.1 ABC transporter ATP-binding protein [Winslowiella arboricola]MCU5778071.1 ABC transporter ATP-binding protein [Winslowiella arboricola]
MTMEQTLTSHQPPLLSVRHLTVSLPKGMDRACAVEDISFDLIAGEILCIIGESGSGKSVTAHAAMGLLPAALTVTHGEIVLTGEDILTASPAMLRSLQGKTIAMVFQDPLSALNPIMTIGKQIAEVMSAHNVGTTASRQEKVLSLLEEVGLPDPASVQHQYPFNLSGGQRQRVMIAMALALDPDVLIADEPTTALDVTTQAQILQLIRTLQSRKQMSVMFITHDFGVVEEIADRVIVMRSGQIVEQGTARQLLTDPAHPYTRQLLDAVPQLRKAARSRQANPPVVLKVVDLCKTYQKNSGFFSRGRQVRALNSVSFTLRKGETLGVVGESGSGKSSLGRVLVKLLAADSGQIFFDGRDIVPIKENEFRPLRPLIQMIFQDPFASLNPRHTIGTILSVGPLTHGGVTPHEVRQKALRLLALVGLEPGAYERYPHEFSGGQRQRIGIARALMFDPLLLVADESVSALDVSVQAQVLALLAEVQRKTHVSILFITHDLRVASQICDEILVLYKGDVVETGTPEAVFTAPQHRYTQTLVSAIPGSDR